MQTRAFLGFIVGAVFAKPAAQQSHEWLSPSRSMVTVVAVERKCPTPEFELMANDICLKVLEIPAEATCTRSSATFQEESQMCVTTEFFPPERVCPPNAVFNGEECDVFKVHSVGTQCEKGDELVNGECWRYEQRTPSFACPKNYQQRGDRCVTSSTTTPDLVCPADFKMTSDESCVKVDVQAVQPDCPEHSIYHNGLCVSELGLTAAKARPPVNLSQSPLHRAALPELPQNLDAILAPSKRCVSGGELDELGRCVSVTSVEADIVCPSGYAMNSGRCDKPVTNAPSFRCPANFVLQGDICVQTVPAEPYCNGEKETLTTSGTCISLHSEPPIRSCPQRSVMSPDGRCAVQVIYENDLELYCDPASAAASTRLARMASPPIASYSLVNDVCVKVVKNRHVMTCPQNYIFTSQNTCVLSQTARPNPECRNSVYDHQTGQCLSTTTVDQLIQCPKGYEIDSNSKLCRLKKTYHPQLNCPEGYTLKKKRSASDRGGSDRGGNSERGGSDRGSSDRGGNSERGGSGGAGGPSSSFECHLHQTLSAEMTCGELGDLENGTCVHRILNEPIKTCKEGFHLDDEMKVCQQTIETLVVKTCPTDYKQVGNACVGKVPTETQTLTNEDRRLLIDALQGFTVNKKSGGMAPTNKRKPESLNGQSFNDINTTAVLSTNDQDLLSMAEILAKWQRSRKRQ